jgi:hypothetical protein
MYAIVENNEITKIITNPKSLVIGDVRYPAKIFQLWSQSELNAIGIYEVITDSTNKKDEAYYINTNEEYNFADNQVTRSWGTATPKRLNDENAVYENGDPVLDDDGNQVINYGLKTEKKRIVKQQASGLLAPTDWYVIKATEVADYSVPENITTFRADVRTKSNEMETAIDNASDVDALKTLYEYTNTGTEADPVFTRPLGKFPTLEN